MNNSEYFENNKSKYSNNHSTDITNNLTKRFKKSNNLILKANVDNDLKINNNLNKTNNCNKNRNSISIISTDFNIKFLYLKLFKYIFKLSISDTNINIGDLKNFIKNNDNIYFNMIKSSYVIINPNNNKILTKNHIQLIYFSRLLLKPINSSLFTYKERRKNINIVNYINISQLKQNSSLNYNIIYLFKDKKILSVIKIFKNYFIIQAKEQKILIKYKKSEITNITVKSKNNCIIGIKSINLKISSESTNIIIKNLKLIFI